jgi:molybdopterin-guanine dinucleotide biosynthesis protein A
VAHLPTMQAEQWQSLLLAADRAMTALDLPAAALLQDGAWEQARDRELQAATLHSIGRRWWLDDERDTAAAHFELARVLRRGFATQRLVASSELALSRMRRTLAYDAVILSGGRGRRLGGPPKPERRVADWPLLDHVLLAVSGATRRVVVGPVRRGLAEPEFCQEDPIGAGPLAGIATAAARVSQPLVAVLAADLPFIGPALTLLRSAVVTEEADVAALVDTAGRVNYLAAVWRLPALAAAMARLGDPTGGRVRDLFEGVNASYVPDFDGLAADVDTPNDLQAARERVLQPGAGTPRHDLSGAAPGLPPTPLAWPGLALHAPS